MSTSPSTSASALVVTTGTVVAILATMSRRRLGGSHDAGFEERPTGLPGGVVSFKRRTRLPEYCTLDPARNLNKTGDLATNGKRTAQDNAAQQQQQQQHPSKKNDVDLVLWFEQVGKEDAYLVGGKGGNLGELIQNGFPVPEGFCITKNAFNQHLSKSSHGSAKKTLLERIESGEMTSKEAREAVLGAEMSPQLERQIAEAYVKLSGGDERCLVAVRSSATAEDSADASFAGQLDTYLGVSTTKDVIKAVKECWASMYSDRVDSYRQLAGKARGGGGGFSNGAAALGSSVSCCVVVQKMLDADAAGVMFTANPFNSRRDELVITANFGLGESVVADIATPDTWIVKEGKIISTEIAKKLKKVVLRKNLKGSQKGESVHHIGSEDTSSTSLTVDIADPVEQTKPCLTEAQVLALGELGRNIEKHYGSLPQDVEFGFKGGKCYLLQSRPITTLATESGEGASSSSSSSSSSNDTPLVTISSSVPVSMTEFDAPCRPDDWITTCNASEMFPGPMTPLTMSMFGRMADWAVQRLHIDIGVRNAIDLQNPVTGTYSGNFFLNMTNTLAPICAGMMGAKMAKENGEMSILGRMNEGETLERLIRCGGGAKFVPLRMLNGMRYLRTMLLAHRRVPRMLARIEECETLLLRRNPETGRPACEIWAEMDSLMDAFDDQWADGVVTSSTSGFSMLFAMKLLTPRGGDVWGTEPVAEFAALLGEVNESRGIAESAGAVEALDVLKEEMLKKADKTELKRRFVESEPAQAMAYLMGLPELGRDFRTLLDKHGHRCIKESEMRERDWSEDPIPLIKMLQGSIKQRLAGTAGSSEKDKVTRRGLTPSEIITSKRHLNFITRPLLRRVIDYTRGTVHLRELGKSLQVKLNSIFKRAYRRLARALAEEGRLPDPDLTYFLTHQELGVMSCCHKEHPAVHDLRSRALQRRRLLPAQRALTYPDLHCGVPKPHPPRRAEGLGSLVAGTQLKGTPVSAGSVTGKVRVARTLEEAEGLEEGEILVTPQTDVGWTPMFGVAGGLITEKGGMLSHGAVVAREYSLPCVVGMADACSILRTGVVIQLNGDQGWVRVI